MAASPPTVLFLLTSGVFFPPFSIGKGYNFKTSFDHEERWVYKGSVNFKKKLETLFIFHISKIVEHFIVEFKDPRAIDYEWPFAGFWIRYDYR